LETPQWAPGELEAIERQELEEHEREVRAIHPFDG
jgi:hypothetical protein